MRIALTAATQVNQGAPIVLCGPYERSFEIASEMGYAGIELHLQSPDEVDPHVVKELCSEFGLEVPTIGTGMAATREHLTFTDKDSATRQRAVDRIFGYIDLAAFIGSAVTIGLIYGSRGRNWQDTESTEKVAEECLERCARRAESNGVTLFLEAINRYELDQNNTLMDVVSKIERIGSRSVRLLADTFHMNIEERDIVGALKSSATYLGHVHLADSNREAPGRGHIPMKSIVEALVQVDFAGYLSFEVLPLPSCREAAAAARDCVQRLLA